MCLCVFNGNLPVVSEKVLCLSIVDWHGDEMMPIEMVTSIANARKECGQIVAFPSNVSSRGEIALLYNLVGVAPVLGSSKFTTVCERPGPNAKAGGAGGAASSASGGSSGAGRTGGAAAASGWAGGAGCPWSMFPCGGCACGARQAS